MIAVVGGGITGLAVGWELQRRGVEVVVLEEESEVGGVVRSRKVQGRVVDFGPQRTRLTPGIEETIDELGLLDRVVTAPPDLDLFVYRDGRLRTVPFSVRDFITSDIVGPWAKARVLLEPLTRGADARERVADYFIRKLGRSAYEGLVGPLYGGLYGSDPADMQVGLSLAHVLRQLGVGRSLLLPLLRRGGRVRPPPAITFRDGMQELPRALARALGGRVRTGVRVEGLRSRPGGWRLDHAGGVVEAEAVVVCTTAPAAASLLAGVAPGAAAALERLRYNPLGVVHLESSAELRGLGFQVALSETSLALRGVTFNHALFGRTDLYTAYLGGARSPRVVELPDAELGTLARTEFRECMGHDASVLSVRRTKMPAWDMSWAALDHLEVPDGLHLAGGWRSRPGLPGRLAEAEQLVRRLAPDTVRSAVSWSGA
jgi:protoporphyrinogen/coproporphyrinogen III oxidase